MTAQKGLAQLAETEERAYQNMRYALARWYQYGGRWLSGIELAIAAKDTGRIKGCVCACLHCDDTGDINVVNPHGDLAVILRLIANQAQVVENCHRIRKRIQRN